MHCNKKNYNGGMYYLKSLYISLYTMNYKYSLNSDPDIASSIQKNVFIWNFYKKKLFCNINERV